MLRRGKSSGRTGKKRFFTGSSPGRCAKSSGECPVVSMIAHNFCSFPICPAARFKNEPDPTGVPGNVRAGNSDTGEKRPSWSIAAEKAAFGADAF